MSSELLSCLRKKPMVFDMQLLRYIWIFLHLLLCYAFSNGRGYIHCIQQIVCGPQSMKIKNKKFDKIRAAMVSKYRVNMVIDIIFITKQRDWANKIVVKNVNTDPSKAGNLDLHIQSSYIKESCTLYGKKLPLQATQNSLS